MVVSFKVEVDICTRFWEKALLISPKINNGNMKKSIHHKDYQ